MEVLTTERGTPSRVEANIQVALRQGRISAGEAQRWRDYYLSTDYETATKALLGRKAVFSTHQPSARPVRVRVSEQAYEAYAQATGVRRPAFVYLRNDY